MHGGNATQVALILRGLLGQDVTLEGLAALNGTTWTNAKTLLRAALGFHFGHVNAPVYCAREAPVQPAQILLAPRHFLGAGLRQRFSNSFEPQNRNLPLQAGLLKFYPSLSCAAAFCSRLCTSSRRLFARRGDHHNHLSAFQLRELLHLDGISQLITQTIEQINTQLLVRNFTTTEAQSHLDLIALS